MIHTVPHSCAAELALMAQRILPENVSIATGDPWLEAQNLHPLEQVCTGKMCGKRRIEFCSGRHVARQAMARFGYGAAPVPMASDRSPVWPTNIVGSLSHTATACIAVAALAQDFVALGVDLEVDQPLEDALITEVCQDAEMSWLSRQPQNMRGRLARLIFSAKETAYKAQYPLTKALFGFDQFAVSFDFSKGRFTAKFTGAVGGFSENQCLNGCFQIGNGLILTTMPLTSSDWKG